MVYVLTEDRISFKNVEIPSVRLGTLKGLLGFEEGFSHGPSPHSVMAVTGYLENNSSVIRDDQILSSCAYRFLYVMCEPIPAASIPPDKPLRRANAGHLKKLAKCPAQPGNLCWQMPRPRSYYDVQMPPLSIRSIYKNISCLFNKNNHEMSHSD